MQPMLRETVQLLSSIHFSPWRPKGFIKDRRLLPRDSVTHEPQSGAMRFMASGTSQSTTYKASLRYQVHQAYL